MGTRGLLQGTPALPRRPSPPYRPRLDPRRRIDLLPLSLSPFLLSLILLPLSLPSSSFSSFPHFLLPHYLAPCTLLTRYTYAGAYRTRISQTFFDNKIAVVNLLISRFSFYKDNFYFAVSFFGRFNISFRILYINILFFISSR